MHGLRGGAQNTRFSFLGHPPARRLSTSLIGVSLLWVGWFGFNAGSATTAGTGAGMAMAATQAPPQRPAGGPPCSDRALPPWAVATPSA